MVEVAKTVLEFIFVFLIVYLCYYIFSYKKIKKFNRKKMPLGVKYLVYRYNIDVVRLGYKNIMKRLMLCDSFIVALVFIVTGLVDNIYIRLLVAFILIFPVFAGVYHLIAYYYKKEEMK